MVMILKRVGEGKKWLGKVFSYDLVFAHEYVEDEDYRCAKETTERLENFTVKEHG